MDDHIDLKKLAEEAAASVYLPRAKKCWPWSHEWTMWQQEVKPPYYLSQIKWWVRTCVRCGKPQTKNIY